MQHHDDFKIPVKSEIAANAYVSQEKYLAMYKKSLEDINGFWSEQTKIIDWIQPFTAVKNTSFNEPVTVEWFKDGKLNIASNCVDRHLKDKADQIAIIWEGDDPKDSKKITYAELYQEMCRFANVLKNRGVKKGDRVIIYMPMIPEAAYAMLACARLGAIHSVVFGGFSATSLASRIEDCGAKIIITADAGVRGGKIIPLKQNVDDAVENLLNKNLAIVTDVIVVNHKNINVNMLQKRDIYYHEAVKTVSSDCAPEIMDSLDPFFILYTSGSTGKPKGVMHQTGGYIVYAALTHKYIFDYRPGEVYWCTADIGWVTGHSYMIYGPLANGATTLMFEGVPNYPSWSRFWEVVDKHKVNIFYTAPTAIRAIMREGDEYLQSTSRDSLRILGSVGEPINKEAWLWYYNMVGKAKCPVMDTWWQTETGGILITPLPGAIDLKPGSATLPFFGVRPAIVDKDGNILEGEAEGNLCILDSWPGQMCGVYGDEARFAKTYFSDFKGKYFSGDGARRDKDGYYWITGRVDDVLNVSGHRIGTAEIETSLAGNENVAEAAVVGYSHDIKGQAIYAFVILKSHNNIDDKERENFKKELIAWVRKDIGAIAAPDKIQFTSGLPKTRSGKIMRRILRKIAENDYSNLGDTNTLLNPEIVDDLVKGRL